MKTKLKSILNLFLFTFFSLTLLGQPTDYTVSYPFNGNANDVSGNNKNAGVVGASLTSDRFGNTNSAYFFNGSSNLMYMPNTVLSNSNAFSISCWIKPAGNHFSSDIYSQTIIDLRGQYQIALSYNQPSNPTTPNSIQFYIYSNPTSVVLTSPSNSIQLNTWSHIVATYGNNTMTLYINGNLVSTQTINTPSAVSGYNNTIGKDYATWNNRGWVYGSIDDIKIYNRSLTPSEVLSLYQEGGILDAAFFGDVQPNSQQIGNYEKYELKLDVPDFTGNPYNPNEIDLYAIFTSPSGKTYRDNGFYNTNYDFNETDCMKLPGGDYGNSYYENKKLNAINSDWRIRFTPKETGTWKVNVYCLLGGNRLMIYPTILNFQSLASPSSGFIKVSGNNKNLQFENGNPLFLIGENMESANSSDYTISNETIGAGCSSNWGEIVNPNYKTGGISMFKKWLQELSSAGGNYIRLGVNKVDLVKKVNDEYIYNSETAFRFDKFIEIALEKNINVKFNIVPQALITDCNFFNTQSTDFVNLKNYLRYIVARYGYTTNLVSWEILDEVYILNPNENLCVTSNPQSVVNWFAQVKSCFKSLDGNHLVSAGGLCWGNGFEFDSNDFRYQIANMMDLIEIHSSSGVDFTNDPNGKENSIQDLCKLPIKTNDFVDDSRRFFSDLISVRNTMKKPVLLNSFWYGSNGSRSDHFGDPNGFYEHNAIWLSLFSNPIGTAAPWDWYSTHPGYYRKAGYFNYYYCINDFTDKQLDFTPGQLNHFKQVSQFAQNIDFSVDWESVANFSTSDITITNSNIRAVALRNPSKNLYYGWLQDKKYQYNMLIANNCTYLKTLSDGKPMPLISGAQLNVKVSEPGCYQIKWYRINHDDISVENIMSSASASNGFVTFDIPQLAYNAIYGDMAFIIKKVIPNDHYAEFKINDIIDGRIDICGSSPILLTAFETYCEESEHYFINIQECDINMNVFGRELTYLTYSLPRDFDIRAYCSQNSFTLLPGHYYKVKLSLSNPYNANGKILYIKTQAVPDFKIMDACGNWVQQYNSGYVVIDNEPGAPLWVDATITDCANKYNVIVQECDLSWNRYDFCKSWGKWYSGHPGVFDVQQLLRNTVEGFNLFGGLLDNGLDRYYKIQIATNEPDGNWTPITILVRKEPIDCGSYSTLKSSDERNKTRPNQSPNRITIYPNPNNGRFKLTLPESNSQVYLKVLNSNGVNVYSQTFNDSSSNKELNLSNLPKGYYILSIKSDSYNVLEKFIIQ